MRKDIEHLNLLAIFHYVMGGLDVLFSLFPLLYVFIGLVVINAPRNPNAPGPPPAAIGWFFVAFGAGASLLLLAAGVMSITAGRCLHTQKWRMFCYVNSAIGLIQMPHGTVLAVFTILVLSRQSVADLFDGKISPEDDRRLRRDPEDDDDYRAPREYDRPRAGGEGYYERGEDDR
jgi:hypothetical protein